MRVILAVLLLAIPVAWLGLRAPSEGPSSPGKAQASSRSGPSSVTPGPRATEAEEETPEDEEWAFEEGAEEEEFLDENELKGPGPCIELVVTAQGVPVGN